MEVTERKRGPLEDWLGEITKTREVDRDFKRQVCLHAGKTFILKISKNVSSN